MTSGSGGGSGTNTVVQQSQPPQQILDAYSKLTDTAFNQAAQPQQQYTGPLVAGFTPQQQQAFQGIGNAQGIAAPYINAAAQSFGQAMTPFYQTVGNYESPYTSSVTDALTNLFNQQNAQQLQQVRGNAVSKNAYGGDREAVAEALTAQQQQLAEAPTLANVLQGGYQTALGAAEAQGWLGQQGGFGLGNLGQEAQNTTLSGANALLQSGGLQQQLAQEQLNIPYEQWQSQQAYPWQVLGAISPIVQGTGSLSGGTGTTSYPGPSLVSQLGGLGVTGLGTYGLLKSTGALSGLGDLLGGAGAGAIPAADAAAALSAAGGLGGISATLGAGGGISPLAAAGAGLIFKHGGRTGYAEGGGIGTNPSIPTVPTISLDYLAHPGPAIKGAGPPQAPQAPAAAQDMSPAQELQLFNGMDKMLKSSGGIGGSANGGRIGLQDGGTSPLAAVETTSAPLAGMPPMQQGFAQKLQTMPMDQLAALSVRMPPSSPYGQIVSRVLNSRRMQPSAAPNQVSSASGVPIGTGIGQVGQMGQNGMSQMSPFGGSSGAIGQGMAAGGTPRPALAEDPDMDPHPVVDHSGETVVIHYPSEGQSLDLGIPSSPSQRTGSTGMASGGSPPSFTVGEKPDSPVFTNSLISPSGINIPQLDVAAISHPSVNAEPGGGIGNWYVPLPQKEGPSGLSSTGAASPFAAPPVAPSAVTGTDGTGSIGVTSPDLSNPVAYAEWLSAGSGTPVNDLLNANAGSGGGKYGGRMGYQDGGDVVMDPSGGISLPTSDILRAHEEMSPREAAQPIKPETYGRGVFKTTLLPSAEYLPPVARPAERAASPFDEAFKAFASTREAATPSSAHPVEPGSENQDRPLSIGLPSPSGGRQNLATAAADLRGGVGEPTATATPQAEGLPAPEGTAAIPPENKPPPATAGIGAVAPLGSSPAQPPRQTQAQPAEPSAAYAPTSQAPEGLVQRIWRTEGSGDTAVSPKGAIGKGQIMPSTAVPYLQPGETTNSLFDRAVNERISRSIINDLWKQYKGNPLAVMVAYNAGPRVADKWLASGQDPSVLPRETQRYIGSVGQGGGVGGPPDQVVGGRGGIGGTRDQNGVSGVRPPGGGGGIGEPTTGIGGADIGFGSPRVPAAQPAHETPWQQSPWLPVIAAGLGIMGSRSPYPLTAVGQGGLEGVKTAMAQSEQGMRERQIENEAANRTAILAQNEEHYRAPSAYQTAELEQRNRQFDQQLIAEQHRFDAEMKRNQNAEDRNAIIDKHFQDQTAILAAKNAANMAKPLSYYDPKTGQAGNATFDPNTGAYNIPEGAVIGKPPTAGPVAALKFKHDAWIAANPGDEAGALQFMNGQKAMRPEEINKAAEALTQRDIKEDYTLLGKTEEEKAQKHDELLKKYVSEITQPIPSSAPTAATAPATTQPAALPPPDPDHIDQIQSGHVYRWINGKYQSIGEAPAQP